MALNVLPALWRSSVQGVNFQTIDGNLNQMITAEDSASGWSVSVEPEYYGLLTFADAAPAGSHLLRISSSGLPHFYEFAARAPNRSERVVLTNVGSAARTGQLSGTPHLTLVTPNTKGVYAVRVPAHSAAVLALST